MNSRITATELFLGVLALLLVGVSFWQTNVGLDQIFGNASLPVALVLSLVMLFLIWKISQKKKQGESAGKFLRIYLFFASFCFIANFNAIYTKFKGDLIYKDEIKRLNAKFSALQSNIDGLFVYTIDNNKKQEVLSLVDQLKLQIQDPANKGIGPESRAIISRIENILGKKLTLLTPETNTEEGYRDLSERMEKQVYDMISRLTPEQQELKEKVGEAVVRWNENTVQLLSAPKNTDSKLFVIKIDQMVIEYNNLGKEAEQILGKNKYKFKEIKSEAEEVGKIGYAFKYGFRDNFDIYTILILLVCILLDFGIVYIVLLTTEEDKNNNRNNVFSKNRGKTII